MSYTNCLPRLMALTGLPSCVLTCFFLASPSLVQPSLCSLRLRRHLKLLLEHMLIATAPKKEYQSYTFVTCYLTSTRPPAVCLSDRPSQRPNAPPSDRPSVRPTVRPSDRPTVQQPDGPHRATHAGTSCPQCGRSIHTMYTYTKKRNFPN